MTREKSSYPLYHTLSGGKKSDPAPTPASLAKLVSSLLENGEEEKINAVVMLIVEHFRVTESIEYQDIGLFQSSDGDPFFSIDFKDAPLQLRKILGRFLIRPSE